MVAVVDEDGAWLTIDFMVVHCADGEVSPRGEEGGGRRGRGGCGGIWGEEIQISRRVLLIQEYSLVILLVILPLILSLILSSWYSTRYSRSMAFLILSVHSSHSIEQWLCAAIRKTR